MQTRRMRIAFAGTVLGVALVGVIGGTAIAQVPGLLSPGGITAGEGYDAEPAQAPEYPRNEAGQTYGSGAEAISPETEPDLILVVDSTGHLGYVLKADLDAVNGTAAAEGFKSPEDALAWQNANAGKVSVLTVYSNDGKTVTGEFVVVNEAKIAD